MVIKFIDPDKNGKYIPCVNDEELPSIEILKSLRGTYFIRVFDKDGKFLYGHEAFTTKERDRYILKHRLSLQ